jgi:hypothetical protein
MFSTSSDKLPDDSKSPTTSVGDSSKSDQTSNLRMIKC